jgi:hypothetical protein
MNSFISRYFKAEQAESILFILVGLVAIGLSIFFWTRLKQPLYSGMAWPLVAIALIQIVVGTTVFVRSPKDILRVENIILSRPEEITSLEIPRMEVVVMKNFQTYKYIEIALIFIGLGLSIFLNDPFWKGVGLGLFIQSAFMLVLDFFAMSRGQIYLDHLKSL